MQKLFINISSAIKRRVRNFLYTPGREWLCGIIATVGVSLLKRKVHKIFFEDGVWINKDKDGAITDRNINIVLSLTEYEKNARDYWFFVYQPKAGDTIVDIGAGKGEDTYCFSKLVGQAGKVLSIEAHPVTFQCLSKFCKYNSLKNTTPLNMAICDKGTEVTIDDPDCDLFGTILNSLGSLKVQGTPLDAIIEKLGVNVIDFIKMNIEGAEKLALYGMVESLKKTKYVCVSCHDFIADARGIEAMRTKKEVVAFLRQHGFSIKLREDDKRDYIRDQINAVNDQLVRQGNHPAENTVHGVI